MFDSAIGLKAKYRNGEPILGVAMPPDTTPDRFDAIWEQDTYDFVSVDSQHTPFNEERLAAFCDMAAERDAFVQSYKPELREKYRDMGVQVLLESPKV